MLAFRDAYWEEDRAKVVMADLIAAYPQIDGVWCDGSQDAAGRDEGVACSQEAFSAGDRGRLQRAVKALPGTERNYPKFKIGLLSEPTWEGVIALRTALKLLNGEDVPKRQIIEPRLITSENYKDYLRPDLA